MELQVSTLPGMHDCFVALPLHVIEALQGQQKIDLFSVVLELRSPDRADGKNRWYLFWAGAVSSSSCIEVNKKLAECVGLPDGATLRLRALTNVANASSVEVEPVTEDDWEILELNAGFVEGHILNQVGVLCSGQLFPIWVQGDVSLTLQVTSTTPKQMVRLVPGTELIVAPKLRKTLVTAPTSEQATVEPSIVKATLRVQGLDSSLLQPSAVGNFSGFIAPTTSVFVSEISAKKIPLLNGQLVIITPLDGVIKLKEQNGRSKAENKNGGNIDDSKKEVVVRVVYCHLAANGHVMIASSIQQFLGAEIHTRIQVRSYTVGQSMINPVIMVSPTEFKEVERTLNNTRNATHMQDVGSNIVADRPSDGSLMNWGKHKHLLDLLYVQHENLEHVEKEGAIDGGESTTGGKLFKLWAAAQLRSIHECEAESSKSFPISNETVMEFLMPIAPRHRNSIKRVSFEEHMGNSSEILHFLISLQNSDDHDEKRAGFEIKQPRLFMLEESLLGTKADLPMPMEVLTYKLGQPQVVPSSIETKLEVQQAPHLASMTWLKEPASHALERLQFLLSSEALERCEQFHLPLPGSVLLHGPPASGKTKLALAIAKELEENPSILAHKVMVKCSELVGEQVQTIRTSLQGAIVQALKHAPSLIILDDLDMAVPSNSSPESRELSASSAVLTEFLSDILDSLQDHARSRYGCCIAFLVLVQTVSSLPTPLRSSGRFDLHVGLPTPATEERAAILLQELVNRKLICDQDIVSETALKCDGYDAFDLEVLVDRAVHAASTRLLPLSTWNVDTNKGERNGGIKSLQNWKGRNFKILKEDFEEAFNGFLPVAMRDITKPTGQIGRLSWEDIGGLNDTCQTLQEMLELPVKYSKIFSNAPLRLRSGVLLYGPPGCGKTHVVGIAAAACSLRLISVKGPELLNKYIGASEQGVRDIFAKATAAAPCILFFDEFDAIAPKRGHDNTGVTDRVVNQLLTELDGVEALNGVFVFAATSRPDLLDAALLRPGRLDRLLLCDFPSRSERLEILQVLSRKLPLSDDVNLDAVASLTENFSGADLQAVLSDAQLEAVHSFLSETKVIGSPGKSENTKITMTILTSVLLKARPSVSDTERRRLYNIYEMFMNSRSSLSQKARDAKGKRATLA